MKESGMGERKPQKT